MPRLNANLFFRVARTQAKGIIMYKANDAIDGATKEIGDEAKSFGREIQKVAKSIGEDVQSRADDIGDAVRDESKAVYSKVRSQVRSNPAMALGAAVGIGMLVGFLINGRR
jgi:ElaB/YqjD/DUF883 family membrane-anchored ribosome-binding protein